MDVAIWNVLHDGIITEVMGSIPGDLRVKVEIPYLYPFLPTRTANIFVMLRDCGCFKYLPYEQAAVTDPVIIAGLELEMLSAVRSGNEVEVECRNRSYGGQLRLQYRSAKASTDDGLELSQETLETAAQNYWDKWSQRLDSSR
jgi:hypothetical protein